MPPELSNVLTVLVLVAAVFSDLRTRRIPNLLTISAAVAGLLLHLSFGGWPAAWQSVLGCTVGIALLLVPCLVGWVGGGDLKLLGAVGALQGPGLAIWSGLYGFAIGGVLAVAIAWWASRQGESIRGTRRRTLAYGPALALGTALAVVLH